jgi:hypothetical protein
MDSSSSPAAVVSVRPDKIPRARPVIELNLNVEEAMIEAVDLLRSIRVQLEGITGTVNDRLNRTFSDVREGEGRREGGTIELSNLERA